MGISAAMSHGFMLALDHEIDEAGGEHPVGVAIGAKAAEAHPRGKRIERGKLCPGEHAGLGCIESGPAQSGARAHGKTPVAEVGALAVADKALAQERLIQQADDASATVLQRDQRAPGRHAGDERLGAVDGVDDPGEAGIRALVPVLLAEDAVVGASLSLLISARIAASASRSATVTGE